MVDPLDHDAETVEFRQPTVDGLTFVDPFAQTSVTIVEVLKGDALADP